MRPEVKELYLFLKEVMTQLRPTGEPKISVEDFVNQACILCSKAFYLDAAMHRNDSFSYFASASFGISEYPCYSLEHRIKYLTEMTSFASLYANKITIKCPFEAYIAEEAYSDKMWIYIIPEIIAILVLEPLADMNLLSMTLEYFMLDSGHKKYVLELEDLLLSENKINYDKMMIHLMDQAEVKLGKFKNGEVWLKVEGPDDYIFQGITYLHGILPESLTRYAVISEEIKVSQKVKEKIVARYVAEYCRNAFLARYNNSLFGTTFLSPVSVEIDAFRGSSEENISEFDIITRIPHHLTYLKNITPYQMIEFREYEGEAFENYRNHMTELISKVKSTKTSDVDAMIKDHIEKDIHNINKVIKQYRSKAKQDLGNELISMGIYAIAGTAAGSIDLKLGALASLFAVPTFAQKIVEKTVNLGKTPDEARSPNYFLWALKNTYVREEK